MRKIRKAKEQELKRLNLNISTELHNAFKSATAAEGKNMTDILLEFIQQYVADHSSPKPKGRRR